MEENKKKKRGFFDNIIVLYLGVFMVALIGEILGQTLVLIPYGFACVFVPSLQNSDFLVTSITYVSFIGTWIVMLLWLLIKKNRPIFKVLWTKQKGNNIINLLIGFAIGFVANGLCILGAFLHKDIALHFDSIRPISLIMIFIFVFIQSSAEEFICRGFLYQRLLKSYKKPVVAIIGNAMLFGLLHLGNDGVTIISVINIVLSGILMSLAVYYMDSFWCAMAIHTVWNFTQNIIFGLPNSGKVLPYSIMKLDVSTARDSFAYNVGFGVEGTILADVILAVACVLFFLWGKKFGKKPIDLWEEKEGEIAFS